MSYTRKIEMPKTKLQGLVNFVQMIINQIEAGEIREALLTAVDLRQDLDSKANPYAEVTDGRGNALIRELEEKHTAELAKVQHEAFEQGKESGRDEEKNRIRQKLEL